MNSYPEYFLDDVLGKLFKIDAPEKPKRKTKSPDYGKFRRLCKKNALTYTVTNDGYVDVETPDGTRFAIGENWDQRLSRLETILETGYDPGHGGVAWPERIPRK